MKPKKRETHKIKNESTKDKNRKWFKVDNTGKLYPSIVSKRVSTIFRFTVLMKKEVDPFALQNALDNTISMFPGFQVVLKRGFFWYYFDRTDISPMVERETYYPCMYLDYKEGNTLPFRVIYYKNKICLEMSHALTDGMGAITFIKALLTHYLNITEVTFDQDPKDIVDYLHLKKAVFEDAAYRNYIKKLPSPKKNPKAYHLPFGYNTPGEYQIITGLVSAKALSELSSSYNTSPTRFLIALYFETLLEFRESEKISKHSEPIVLNIPVDLRRIYGESSLRNFFISITPSIDPRLGHYTLEELVTIVDAYFKMTITKKQLDRYLSRNIRNEQMMALRIIPIGLKNIILPRIYVRFGEKTYTSSISNLGKVNLPAVFDDYISHFEVYPPPSAINLLKICMITYNDITSIAFGSIADNKRIETAFFRKLVKMGLHVKIESNERQERRK